MRSIFVVIAMLAGFAVQAAEPVVQVQDKLSALPPGSIQMSGYIGEKLDLCVQNRVMAQKVDDFVLPYDKKDDGYWGFRGEFWGKWYTSAMLAYGYTQNPDHRKIIDEAASKLIQTQTEDGYIGSTAVAKGERQQCQWDIWGRKYALLGLIANYDQTGDENVLKAAVRAADCLIEEFGSESGHNIAEASWPGWKGLPSSSVLEPIALLYQRTGEPRFLEFAEHIVKMWEVPNKNTSAPLRLVQGAIEKMPLRKLAGAPKAYEMMSCFEGLCELYRCTGNELYLQAVTSLAENILEHEITVVGSGSMLEIWCDTALRQTEPMYQAQETCVTATWIKFLYQLLRLTGESRYADQMEVSLYNALLAAQMPAGNWWSYFTGLMGVRTASHEQFADIHGSCCVANGPRVLMLTPYWATMQSADGLAINQYSPAQITAKTPTGKALGIAIAGDYPRNGTVKISLKPEQAEAFTLKLRVPGWSKATAIKINGEPYTDYIISGTYANIVREWKAGDVVQLDLDMRVRAISAPSGVGDLALMRGPIVLAVDTRLQPLNYAPNPMPRCEFALTADATVDAKLIESADSNIWLTFQVPLKDEGGKDQTIQMCDFASAGNLWSPQNNMRTWIPQPFDARHLYIELNDQATTWPGTVPNVPECYRR